MTMAFKFGPENLAKITCTEYCHDSVGIRPKALLIDIMHINVRSTHLITSSVKLDDIIGWSFKSILSKDIQATETTG